MTKKVDEALATLSRVVPTRFAGEVVTVRAEIERLRCVLEEISEVNEYYGGNIAREALRNDCNI